MSKTALVLGGGGFIGSHLVKKLKNEGFWVRVVDLKYPEFSESTADDYIIGDLREQNIVRMVIDTDFDEVYQLAADMGGAGYIFTGEHDAEIMHNSALINLNVIEACQKKGVKKLFYSSSACMYPSYNQQDPSNPKCSEDSAYPAAPDSEYGWEKLFSERLFSAFARNYGMDIKIARYHNIFGSESAWNDGKEKAPAALCRKVAECPNGGTIEVWGTGLQTRSFLYIDDCLYATTELMRSDFADPVNIGSEEMVSIKELAEMIIEISGKKIDIKFIEGPIGVMGRNSDNKLIQEKLNIHYNTNLKEGLIQLYNWINEQITEQNEAADIQMIA